MSKLSEGITRSVSPWIVEQVRALEDRLDAATSENKRLRATLHEIAFEYADKLDKLRTRHGCDMGWEDGQ
jgi:hypothetical protein